jgi:hypothetical protein
LGFGGPDAVYLNGKIWRGSLGFGGPDAVYLNGKIWRGSLGFGDPDAVYYGPDDGAASIALLLRLI